MALCLRHESIDELGCREITDEWRGLARPKRQKCHTCLLALCLEEWPRETNLSREVQHVRVLHFVNEPITKGARGSSGKSPRQSGVFV